MNRVRCSRLPEAPDGTLRRFEAEVEVGPLSGEVLAIGRIEGWFSWEAWLPELLDNGHVAGSIAETMALVAVEIGERIGRLPESRIEAVVMIDRLELVPEWRGNLLGRRIVEQLIDLMLLAPETTLVLAHVAPGIGPDASPSLHRAYGSYGLEQWQGGGVWWARIDGRATVEQTPV